MLRKLLLFVLQWQDFELVRQVFTYLREDHLQPTMETYMICLAGFSDPSTRDLMVASFIVKDMIKQVN